MLTIRTEQWEALRAVSVRGFERRMLLHLRKFFPEQCSSLGDDGVTLAVRHGIERAEHYGIRMEREVCKYIDVMFSFGRDFDTDTTLPWAASILTDGGIRSSAARIDRLVKAAAREARKADSKLDVGG